MAVYEIAFDVEIDWHEFIEAKDECDAEELARSLLENNEFYHRIIGMLKSELNQLPYIEASCIGEGCEPTITKSEVEQYAKEG